MLIKLIPIKNKNPITIVPPTIQNKTSVASILHAPLLCYFDYNLLSVKENKSCQKRN